MLAGIMFLCLLVSLGNCAHLPSYFTKCRKDDNFNKCILNNIDKTHSYIIHNGDASIKLPNLNPMKIKKTNVQVSDSMQINYNDLEIRGLDIMDIDQSHFYLSIRCPLMQWVGKYDMNGKILILPVSGNGHCNVTVVNSTINFNAKLETTEKKNGKFYNIIPMGCSVVAEHAYYSLENLFNGDKRLGEEMNIFLNENWKEVFTEMKSGIEAIIGLIVKTIVNAFFNNIPTTEIHD